MARLAGRSLGWVLLVLAASCAGTPHPRLVPAPGLPAWELPAAALRTQHLFRAHYGGPGGGGGFKITLRLVDRGRYQARAVDPLGRGLWALDVEAGHGLWIDYRKKAVCHLGDRFDLAGIPLAPFPLEALPALLLGRLPVPPAGAADATGTEVRYRDARGRRWRGRLEGGQVVSWTVWEKGRPAAWWSFRDGEAILSDGRRGAQLRWREVVSEPLAGTLGTLEAPPGFQTAMCRELEVPNAAKGEDGG